MVEVIEIACPMSIATGDGESDPAEGSECTVTRTVFELAVAGGLAPRVTPTSVTVTQ
jgi:hypothetical protein